jgi:hypothetical protein
VTIPEGIRIVYWPPSATMYGYIDITKSVIFADAYFESQAAAVPGSFHLSIKDPDQVHSFVSGGRVEMFLSDIQVFGGFVTVPTRDFFFPADDTSRPVKTRRWSLDGVDYNILLDKRVLRNPADLTHIVPSVPVGANDNDAHIISLFSQYFDLDFAGGGVLDVVSGVPSSPPVNSFIHEWVWTDQGSTMRQVLDALVIQTTIYGALACIYWIDAAARIRWLAIPAPEDAAPWGFSDIPTGPAYKPDGSLEALPFIGWRDGSASEDGSSVINEVFIWGGSPIGTNGQVVMAHEPSSGTSDSITAHGRWQMSENHPGEDLYKSQAEVNARANALISGDTSGTSPVTGAQGLVNPDLQYSLTWFAHDVPSDNLGNRLHIIPGQTVTLNLWSFGEVKTVDGSPAFRPYSVVLPLRQVRITFPTLPSEKPDDFQEYTYVQFQGTFSLSMSDPVWWWQYLLKRLPSPQAQPIITTNNSSASFPYGSYFSGEAQGSPANGSQSLFTIIPTYIPGTLEVYVNGLLKLRGADWNETNPADPAGGSFTFTANPVAGAVIWCTAITGV